MAAKVNTRSFVESLLTNIEQANRTTFSSLFQPETGPNSYEGRSRRAQARALTAVRKFPDALATRAFPAAAFQNDRLTLRGCDYFEAPKKS
jgi:hypothetical protein